ncbi:ELMO/CED-12 family-domain-containing protein [Irpex rosettiformis]|uniref:ELMO/CED-12 family-domain-containing protein n=1 Tax=Irpex rosettiformis TaxID=378272 RepID=A0ACB8UBT5_9APHY|nr:ELMO/CED-12 family-domain-containing protein [Irpex rosettiformis]
MAPPSSSSLGHAPSSISQTNSHSQTTASQSQSNATGKAKTPYTNVVTLPDGNTVRVRIEETLAVDDVVRQLCISVKIKEPSTIYALRDGNDELVTNENLRKKVKAKVPLKLMYSTPIEAAEILEKLVARDNRLGITLTHLRKLIREDQFAIEFLNRDGLSELIDIINKYQGNILAYALTALQHLMELDHGWSDLNDDFIFRVVQILSSETPLINVCRPATAILKKLVEADPMAAPGPTMPSSSKGLPQNAPGSVYKFGFECVFEQMRKEKSLLETVVNRLGSGDTTMALYSMMLINSLLAHATDARWEEFIGELQRLNVRKAVIRLMSSHTIEDLTSCILDFQANMVRVTYRRKTTIVEPEEEPEHAAALNYVWLNSKVREEVDAEGEAVKWRLLGCQTEDLAQEFGEVGVLGLDCLKHFVAQDPDFFAKVIQEQLSRAPERRCPIVKASNEVVDLLSEYWAIFGPGYSTSTTFQPFFLNFNRVHDLATHFFLRMWNESGATRGDFPRVAALVRSQVKVALRKENVRAWHEVEADFNEVEYRAVRDRQMRELEKEDDVMSKAPVRNMRAKLYKESFEFVRQQRIHCLMQGAWFMNAMPLANNASRDTIRRPSRMWRFMRLDSNMKYLHYVDTALKFDIRNGLEDMKDRIDLSLISEIATGTCAPFPQVVRGGNDPPENGVLGGPGSPALPSPLSFSLLTPSGSSLADQIAPDQSRWADWVDGLNMLRSGGHVASNETDMFVQALTEIGLKIRLLNLSGDKAEIPSGIQSGHPPMNSDFFFSDLVYDTQG